MESRQGVKGRRKREMSESDPSGGMVESAGGPGGGNGLWAGSGLIWLVSCLVGLVVSSYVTRIIYNGIMPAELAAGCGLASANAALALLINMMATRRNRDGFVKWGAAGNVLRAMGVLVIILLVKFSGIMKFEPFITAFLAAYFVFMIAETIRLNISSIRDKRGS